MPSTELQRNGGSSLSKAGSSIKHGVTTALSKQSSSGFANQSDASHYGQSLASVLNNPHLGKSGIYSNDSTWGTWLFPVPNDLNAEAVPPTLPSGTLTEISKSDFKVYLDLISEPYSRFADVREHANREQSNEGNAVAAADVEAEGRGTQGEGLVACLREIPSLYFDEDFALEKGSTFQAACPFSSLPQNMLLQEKLSHYLDLVEVHLVKEISARSDSFFKALDQLEDLNSRIVGSCDQIHELQATVNVLSENLIEPARRVQSLEMRRHNLLALIEKLKFVEYVNQAIAAMRLLVAAADTAGSLDVIDDLRLLLEGDELVGLHCFRHLGDQLTAAMESVNSVLAADFVRAAVHDSADLESSAIMAKFNTKGKGFVVHVGDDEENGLRDQLLPIVVGLLRTSKLPAVLRVYRDTLNTDIKAAIRTVVAELLPVLFTRAPDGDLPSADRQADMEVGGVSLAYKLRGLSAESFVQLLSAVFATVQARLVRAAEVRLVIEQIIGGLQGSFAAAAVAAAFASGAAAAAAAEAAQESQTGSSSSSSLTRANSMSISQQFRVDVLRENTEAVCATCDAAHGRWAKLLGVRALIHPKLRLQEFVGIYEITQEFISATEKVGGRLGYSIRGTLQSQSKSFVDYQHTLRMSKLAAVLEQETWVAVDAPDEFQAIVDSLTSTESNGIISPTEDTTDPGIQAGSSTTEGGENPTPNNINTAVSTPNPLPSETLLSDAVATKGKKGREKASVKTLYVQGITYHCVNCGLILLKMIAEYMDISNALPSLATEVVHRVAEILKLYNSRSCQLVLGAGAMQVSGLKSITTKHLALASQSISFFYCLIP
ncbi:unnamed protein product, partial [Sphagnum balticum]